MKRRMNQKQIMNALRSHSGILLDIDIDEFEAVNQKYGRDTGDYILSEIPKRINQVLVSFSIRGEAIRIHNDEFLVVLPDSVEDHDSITEAFLSQIRFPYQFRSEMICITVSIGLTPYSMKQDWTESMERVETAMKSAKTNGKNQTYKS